MRNALPADLARPLVIGTIAVAQALPQCVGGRNEGRGRLVRIFLDDRNFNLV